MSDKKFRNENKYLISYMDYLTIHPVIAAYLNRDPHCTQEGGIYQITSLYFDSPDNMMVKDKDLGIDRRAKMRIRMYCNDPNTMFMEKKIKNNNFISKLRTNISVDEYKRIISGDYSFRGYNAELDALLIYCKNCNLKPAVVVEYDKEVFIHDASNLRITFDMNAHSWLNTLDILAENPIKMPIYENNNMIFEIKYNYYLPSFVRSLVTPLETKRIAFSKFERCLNTIKPLDYI